MKLKDLQELAALYDPETRFPQFTWKRHDWEDDDDDPGYASIWHKGTLFRSDPRGDLTLTIMLSGQKPSVPSTLLRFSATAWTKAGCEWSCQWVLSTDPLDAIEITLDALQAFVGHLS